MRSDIATAAHTGGAGVDRCVELLRIVLLIKILKLLLIFDEHRLEGLKTTQQVLSLLPFGYLLPPDV